MTGLIFLAALALCLYIGWWLVSKLGNLIPNPNWRVMFKVLVMCVLLASPFVDEVIGKQQFEALCKTNGIESADVSKARGKRVKLEVGERSPVRGAIMPIETSAWSYTNADNDELLFKFSNYYAKGGWLMRHTPLSMGSPKPMLFPGNGCNPSLRQGILNAALVTVIN